MFQNEMEEAETKQVESQTEPGEPVEIPDEAFHMVTQLRWEDDVIWNADDVRQKVIESSKKRGAIAGWIPSSATRTCAQYQQCKINYSFSFTAFLY